VAAKGPLPARTRRHAKGRFRQPAGAENGPVISYRIGEEDSARVVALRRHFARKRAAEIHC
jgi:hypothetical protein